VGHAGRSVDSRSEFQDLVHQHVNSLYNYALVLARQDAEDLLQESLVRAYRGFHAFDRSQSFRPWIFTIMRNLQIDRLRQRRPPDESPREQKEAEPVLSLDHPLCSIPLAPEDILLRRETVEQVRDAIRHLPPLLREIVELRDIEGLTYREIATVVRCPVGTVMSRLYRGRNLLRTYLVEPRERRDEKGIGARNK
jgi:RNA polymerase sigma-70 factor (ECF subfamily)